MQELKVPTRSITVEIQTTDGDLSLGVMFHTESRYQTGGAQDIVDELLDERAFVPFHVRSPEGQRSLVNKRHVVWIHVPDLAAADLHADEGDADHAGDLCTLVLDDGSRLTGRLVVPTPPSASRVADKLNQAPAFIPFATERGVHFVSAAHVVRVVEPS